MPAAAPRRRRVFEGILSRVELAFVRDQEPPDCGFEWMSLKSGLEQRNAESRTALVWRSACPQVLREWIRAYPGTRPRCWWAFDAPEPIRATARGSGVPLTWEVTVGRPGQWTDWTNDLAIESQAAYLRRHFLLTAGESQRISPKAYEPEPMVEGGRIIPADSPLRP